MAKDSKSNVEREQALKLVRAFLDIKGGIGELSKGVLRALVACGESENDRLRAISLETLAELSILAPELVTSGGGMKVLTQVLRDGPYDLAEVLLPAFLYLLDRPTTRKYLRAGHDLEVRSMAHFHQIEELILRACFLLLPTPGLSRKRNCVPPQKL